MKYEDKVREVQELYDKASYDDCETVQDFEAVMNLERALIDARLCKVYNKRKAHRILDKARGVGK